MLHAQRSHADHAAAGAVLVRIPGDHAVIHERAFRRVHADVAGAVELRLDLADLGRHEFVVVDERVVAEGAAGRRAGDGHLPAARSERRRLTMVILADGDGLVLLDRAERPHDVRRVLRVIGRAGPVSGAPLRRRPLLVERLVGHRSLQRLRDCEAGHREHGHRHDHLANHSEPHGRLLSANGLGPRRQEREQPSRKGAAAVNSEACGGGLERGAAPGPRLISGSRARGLARPLPGRAPRPDRSRRRLASAPTPRRRA